eukprot:g1079.t1
MALRFLSSEGGRTSDAILALNYAVSMGAVISSNSWGGASHSLALESAVQSAKEGTIASVLLDALGEVNTSLEIGHEFLAVGTYEAHILISGSDHEDEDEAVVPVQLTILGSPYLPAGIFQGMLDFGVVPLGGEGRRTIRLWNYGNGTARVKLNPLASPFAGPLVEVSVEPHESMDLIVTCRPTRTGQFAGNASFGTNSGLPAVEASLADATEKGEQFSMAMSCKGGAVLLQADGLPFHFTPCVPAQWEANFLDAHTTSQTSSSSLTSSSSSSSSSTSGTTTSMTSSTHTATVTSSSTTSSSTISDTTTISVTGTSSTTATVTRTSQTLSSTTSISKTWTSTSFTETTSTQTRNGPPVQILSEPEDVMTIDSTLLVLGVNDTTPGLEDSLQDSISSTVGVDPRRVAISDLGMTLAAVLDDGLRRRLSMMELALEVNFQVILTGLPGESESSELGSSSAASCQDDPSALVSKLSNTLAVETPLRARLTTPKLQQKQAVIVAEEWGTCGPGLTCARSEQLLLRYRAVWCADAENISVQLSSAMCSGNAPRTMEPCPDTVTHPPSCGWHLGSWSECRSQVSDKNSTDVVDNMTTPCDSSGIGHQQREVRLEKQRDPPLPSQAQSDSEGHNSVNTQKQRKKKGPRPPTLELDRYLEDEAPLHSEQEDVEVNYATSPSKSPSKRNASHAFAPAWLRDDGEACGGGTPSHAERFELKSMPPQPLLPQPPTPGGTIPPPPIPKNPEPPSQAPQGLRRGNSKVDFPSVPPSPSTKSTPVAQELSESALPSAPNLPPPPRLASRESEVFSVFSL